MARVIEERIIAEFEAMKTSGRQDAVRLSVRDAVYTSEGSVNYKLWNTDIFCYDRQKDVFMFKASSNGATYSYGAKGVISQTTKSRLSALLWDFCNIGLYQRKYKLYTTNYATELETDKWYVVEQNGLRKL